MKLLDLLRQFIRDYFVIFGILLIANVFLMPPNTINRDYVLLVMAFAAAGNLPSMVFWSKTEPTEQSRRLRHIVHLTLIEIIVLTFGGIAGLVTRVEEYLLFAVQILVIYLITRFITWRGDLATANKINEKLKTLKISNEEQSQ